MLGFYITRPFLPTFITGAIIAYLSLPLYRKVLVYIKNKNLASFFVALFIVIIITVPFFILLGFVSKEAYSTYMTLSNQNLGTNFLKVVCTNENSLTCNAVTWFVGFLPENDLDYYMQTTIETITRFIITNFTKFITAIPLRLRNFFVMIFVVYYLLKDNEIIGRRINNVLPLKETHKKHVLQKFHDIVVAVFYSNIAVAAVQGILGGIGFFALGVSSPLLWGFVMALFALMPYFGTAIVWLPAALNLIFTGYLQNNNSMITKGAILIVYGIFVISTIDNILKPKLIAKKADVHPILVLLGILGGLDLFGFIGLILGPVMLALLMTFVDIYEEEKAELKKYF